MEEWKDVVGFEGFYKISNHGRIMNSRTGKIKKITIAKADGRPYTMLWAENKYKLVRIGRQVLLAFVGPSPLGMEGCHNDGNCQNNHLSNLRWDTPQNNQLDRIRHGTSNRGERCAASKLTEAQARAIKTDPRKQKEIAADYGIRDSLVSRIKSGKRWGHLD